VVNLLSCSPEHLRQTEVAEEGKVLASPEIDKQRILAMMMLYLSRFLATNAGKWFSEHLRKLSAVLLPNVVERTHVYRLV
jgi:hypothetical protein